MNSPQKKVTPKKNSPKKKPKKQKKQSRSIVTRRNQIVLKYRKKTVKKGKGKRGRPRKNPLNILKNESLKVPETESSNVPKNEPVKRLSKRLYNKYMKGSSNVSERATNCRKRKRTPLYYSYWLNGLRWAHNPDEERARSFRKERIVFPSEDEIPEFSPVCRLCEKYSEKAIYVACEQCEGKLSFTCITHLCDLVPLAVTRVKKFLLCPLPLLFSFSSKDSHDLFILGFSTFCSF